MRASVSARNCLHHRRDWTMHRTPASGSIDCLVSTPLPVGTDVQPSVPHLVGREALPLLDTWANVVLPCTFPDVLIVAAFDVG